MNFELVYFEFGAQRRDFGYSTLYPALKRLAKEGLVTWRWGDDKDTGGGRRKYFEIAPLGINSLDKISSFRQELSQIYWGN